MVIRGSLRGQRSLNVLLGVDWPPGRCTRWLPWMRHRAGYQTSLWFGGAAGRWCVESCCLLWAENAANCLSRRRTPGQLRRREEEGKWNIYPHVIPEKHTLLIYLPLSHLCPVYPGWHSQLKEPQSARQEAWTPQEGPAAVTHTPSVSLQPAALSTLSPGDSRSYTWGTETRRTVFKVLHRFVFWGFSIQTPARKWLGLVEWRRELVARPACFLCTK